MPMAARVPSTVATTVATTAMTRVSCRALRICLSPTSSAYHLKEKPPHLARDLDPLKDRAIITTMGEYRNASSSPR